MYLLSVLPHIQECNSTHDQRVFVRLYLQEAVVESVVLGCITGLDFF